MKPWLAQVISKPLEESEVAEFRNSSDSNHTLSLPYRSTRRSAGLVARQASRTAEPLSRERRREFFLEWLAGVWNVATTKIRLGSQAYAGADSVSNSSASGGDARSLEQMPWTNAHSWVRCTRLLRGEP